ncbi:hypothetical protein EDD18DRAFT_1102193 [Armillaria luteobubalina]|uniref:Uncharacterized protein n=1 Tax=Armillaria luteobubalina TaxID=153913 RepID=A0AA39QBR8_9AGAR|nr:hypothetical protein EDD18DRAFT_1102193 [Armillaria luteobubalina]
MATWHALQHDKLFSKHFNSGTLREENEASRQSSGPPDLKSLSMLRPGCGEEGDECAARRRDQTSATSAGSAKLDVKRQANFSKHVPESRNRNIYIIDLSFVSKTLPPDDALLDDTYQLMGLGFEIQAGRRVEELDRLSFPASMYRVWNLTHEYIRCLRINIPLTPLEVFVVTLNTSRHPDPARKEEGVTDCFVVDVHLNIRYTSISATREMESPIGHRNENRCSSWAVLHMTCTVNLVQSFGVTGECGRVTARGSDL